MNTLLTALLFSFLAHTALVAGVTSGQPAPDFTLPGVDGKMHSLSDHKGSFVVLEWVNFDCPFVKKFYGSDTMQKLQADYKAKGVVWLSIVSSAPGKQGHLDAETAPARIAQEKAQPSAFLLDPSGEVGRLYGAKTTPHMFVIDSEGTLIYQGAIDSVRSTKAQDIPIATNYVTDALDAAMNGQPVPTSETKAYGCSVKY